MDTLKPNQIDLGDDHILTFANYQDERAGCSIAHKRPDNGEPCDGWVAFADRAWARSFDHSISVWQVVSENPLTLTPSVACRVCGDHGFVREGRWVKA